MFLQDYFAPRRQIQTFRIPADANQALVLVAISSVSDDYRRETNGITTCESLDSIRDESGPVYRGLIACLEAKLKTKTGFYAESGGRARAFGKLITDAIILPDDRLSCRGLEFAVNERAERPKKNGEAVARASILDYYRRHEPGMMKTWVRGVHELGSTAPLERGITFAFTGEPMPSGYMMALGGEQDQAGLNYGQAFVIFYNNGLVLSMIQRVEPRGTKGVDTHEIGRERAAKKKPLPTTEDSPTKQPPTKPETAEET